MEANSSSLSYEYEARENLTNMFQLNQYSGFIILLMAIYATPGGSMQLTQCRGVNLNVTNDHTVHLKECLTEMKVEAVENIPADKMPCFGKCIFSKNGLIDDKGMPDKDKIHSLVMDQMPEMVHEDLNKRMTNCLSPNNTQMIDPQEATCSSYLPSLMCIHVSFLEVCIANGQGGHRL